MATWLVVSYKESSRFIPANINCEDQFGWQWHVCISAAKSAYSFVGSEFNTSFKKMQYVSIWESVRVFIIQLMWSEKIHRLT